MRTYAAEVAPIMSFTRIPVPVTLAFVAGVAGTLVACGTTVVESDVGGTTGSGAGSTTSASTTSSSSSSSAASSSGAGAGGSTTVATVSSSASSSAAASSNGGIGAQGNPSSTYPASFPAPPQVVNGGGPVLASPKFVPVFFAGDDVSTVASVTDFLAKVGQTSYWTSAVSEYGVGPAVSLAPIMLAETAPTTIDDGTIQTWLAGKLNGDDPAWPANDANTVYVLHYPSSTTITIQDGPQGTATSCQEFGGYHSNTSLDANHGSADVAYAVIPRCGALEGLTPLQDLTGSESHEIIEASTDPYPQTNPAFVQVDDAHFYWELALGGGEIGDMCAQFAGAFTQFPELAYTVQRVWSNKAALAGNDPCVPTPAGEVYFNAAPELPSTSVSVMGQSVQLDAVSIPVGQSKTIELELFSNASTNGPFQVHVDDGNVLMGGAAQLSFSVGAAATTACPTGAPAGSVCVGGENGQTIALTITALSAGQYGVETFWVVSSLAGSTTENVWIGGVTN